MRASRLSILAVLSVAALVVPLGGVATAHTEVFPTSLSISRSPFGRVQAGTVVTFSGRLSSGNQIAPGKRACINNSRIRLVQIGEGVVGSTRTDRRGRYEINEPVNRTARFRVRYLGEVLSAIHPHTHTCRASSSSRIRVPVG
ncbi:MAG: hypothetical protein ACRDGW_04555 [Actinomycetota bacterium]